jgi:type II secretory ATPase GspE/PulE/Tfp pilus assembly ATPase PilB-like protein
MSKQSVTTVADSGHSSSQFAAFLQGASSTDPQFASRFVNWILVSARDAGASDVHVDPAADGLEVRWRLDGVLQRLGQLPKEVGPNVIARLKVLGGLLTYEATLPQEGRIWDEGLRVEVRVSTFPTLYGERAVLRLLGATKQAFDSLAHLGLPPCVLDELTRHLTATSGAVLIVGPAGSGKTTTAYACLRHIVAHSSGGRSIASLEDPIEVAVAGVAQSQVSSSAGFDMATGLRSLLRLDPEVILIGEMRDRATAETALQAALTGQLVVTTFHAGNCGEAVQRLIELGVPDYAVRNAVRLVVAQRLVRRLCDCTQPGDVERDARQIGMNVSQCYIPIGCANCHSTGYRGRSLLAEWASSDGIDAAAALRGDERMWANAKTLIEAGVTSPLEVIRVLGLPKRA